MENSTDITELQVTDMEKRDPEIQGIGVCFQEN